MYLKHPLRTKRWYLVYLDQLGKHEVICVLRFYKIKGVEQVAFVGWNSLRSQAAGYSTSLLNVLRCNPKPVLAQQVKAWNKALYEQAKEWMYSA